MIEYNIKDSTILEVGGRELDFIFNIDKVIEINNTLIVLLGGSFKNKQIVKMSEQPNNGIYAVSSNGEILWNIEVFFRPGNSYGYRGFPDDNFSAIFKDDDGNLVVYKFIGIEYTLDIEKKQIISQLFTK
jgi:hypothetical protein